MGTGAIMGQAEREALATKAKGKSKMDREDFLTLLVAQLSHQDPLNPMEDKEFTGQLAQFSQLEQLTNISKGVDKLNNGSARQEMLGAVSFIGKDVRAKGYTLSKKGSSISTLYYNLGTAAAKGHVNIFDKDGELVRTVQIKDIKAGSHEFVWDGKDSKGKTMADGIYFAYLGAENKNGKSVLVATEVNGKVTGVETENGTSYLTLEDGRTVKFTDVKKVVAPKAAESESEDS